MALATQCPHCAKIFRVAADQLKLRGGIVRCGACHQIFDGNAHLVDFSEPPVPALVPAPSPAPVPEPEPPEAELPIYTVDLSNTFDPLGILPEVAEPQPEPEPDPEREQQPEPEADSEASPVAKIDIDGGALPLLREAAAVETVLEPHPLPTPRIAPPSKTRNLARTRTGSLKPAAATPEPEPEPENDEPEFLKRGRELERTGHTRRIAMLAGSVALALLLALQAATTFRNSLAARYPSLNPALTSLCQTLGCKVELPMAIDALSIETGELQTIGADTFSLVTLLRNQSALTQAWPHIELELTDAADQPLVRRVFTPDEYLAQGAARPPGFAAHSEHPVKLYFQLKDVKASGYHIAVFYP